MWVAVGGLDTQRPPYILWFGAYNSFDHFSHICKMEAWWSSGGFD